MSGYSGNIIKARKARGLTQGQVAQTLGISRPSYINIEAGTKELTISQAKTIASIFHVNFEDIVGAVDGVSIFSDVLSSTAKYKQIILNAIKYGADSDGKITKTKLAKLVYLADFIWYYLKSEPMSGMTYRKLPRGPVAETYFRALDEMEEDGAIARQQNGNAILFSLTETNAPTSKLSDDEIQLIKKIGRAWQGQSTEDIVNFTHEQLPWQICREGEVIPYGLITQEEPEKVYGTVKL